MRQSLALVTCLLLAACGAAPPPAAVDTDNDATAREAARHHELKDAVEAKAYREKAAAAGDAALEADKAKDKALEDAGG